MTECVNNHEKKRGGPSEARIFWKVPKSQRFWGGGPGTGVLWICGRQGQGEKEFGVRISLSGGRFPQGEG